MSQSWQLIIFYHYLVDLGPCLLKLVSKDLSLQRNEIKCCAEVGWELPGTRHERVKGAADTGVRDRVGLDPTTWWSAVRRDVARPVNFPSLQSCFDRKKYIHINFNTCVCASSGYSVETKLIKRLLMSWFFVAPGHLQPWHWVPWGRFKHLV